MKRTPLKRGGRIKTKRKPPLSKADRKASAAWFEEVTKRGCEICPARGEVCDGKVEGHHVVPRQTLRRRGFLHLTWSKSNGIGACYKAHRRHENRTQPIERKLLRPEHEAFAAEYGFIDVLDRLYV